jgi:membrane protein
MRKGQDNPLITDDARHNAVFVTGEARPTPEDKLVTTTSLWRSGQTTSERLWSAIIGGALLAVGFYRRPTRSSQQRMPEMPKGRPSVTTKTKTYVAWTKIARLVCSAFGEHRVVSIAAGVAFFSLLAMFPAVGALVSIYGIFADPGTIRTHLNDLSSLLPGGAIDVIGDQLRRVASGGRTTLGAALVMSLAISLWSANAGMKALFDALNIVYGATERRGLIKLNAISLAFTAGALFLLLVAIATVVVVPGAIAHFQLGRIGDLILLIGRWPALFAIVVLALAVIYRYGPSRENAQWHWITWGGALAAIHWLIASLLFSWYAANFGTYNKTYGSLGAVIGFMTWIWISSIVILAGAEVDAVMEHLDSHKKSQ